MIEIGIDENGFGSLTGPLIITGTLIDWQKREWFEKVVDSKKFFPSRSKNNFKKLEEFVISIYYCLNGKMPSGPVEIIKFLSPDFKCADKNDLCSKNIPEKFLWADTEKGKEDGKNLYEWGEKEGMFFKDVKSKIVCAKNFNDLIKKRNSKFVIDLMNFFEIVKELKKDNVFIHAGKVGGMKFYIKYLRYFFPDYIINTEIESEEKSIYTFEGEKEKFKFGFFLNVEEISFAASISSIVGKYVREIFMESFRKSTGIKEEISGYRDKKTKKALSTLTNFPSECIIRIK